MTGNVKTMLETPTMLLIYFLLICIYIGNSIQDGNKLGIS